MGEMREALSLSMWCIANVSGRRPWLIHSTIRRTRREAWQAFRETWGPSDVDRHLFRPVRVTVGVDRSAA